MLDVLLPAACPACGRPGTVPCPTCWRALRAAPPMPPPPGLDACRSLLVYDGAARELIARVKYRNARSVLGWLAGGMAGLAVDWAIPGTVITWAPTTPERRRERGFDQAELLARRVARLLRLPAVVTVERRPGPAQTGRRARERSTAVVFDVPRRVVRRPFGTVVVVDDVLTTGATLSAAAHALRNAGTTFVAGLTAGRTPLKPGTGSADA